MVRIEDIEPVVVERRQCSDHPAHHRHRVGVAPEREVEAIEAFHRREPSLLDSALDHPPFALDQFELSQTHQVTGMVETFDSAFVAPYDVLVLGGKLTQSGTDRHYPNGRFLRYDYMSADPKPLPLFSWVWVTDMMHGGDPREAQMIWDYFKQWRRNVDGSLTYVGAR